MLSHPLSYIFLFFLNINYNMNTNNNDQVIVRVKHLLETVSNPLELCIEALKIPTESRNELTTKCILPYLQSLPSFTEVIKTASSTKHFDEVMNEIALHMKQETVKKERVVIKNGDKGDKFYLILSGKVSFLVPKYIKCYLNEEEYISHLVKLRNNNEIEILKGTILLNAKIFDIKEDFDAWMNSAMAQYENPKIMNKRYTKETYEKINKAKRLAKIGNERYKGGSINPTLYIHMNNIDNAELNPKDRRLVQIPQYYLINTFEAGQTFGHVALESRNLKRTATAITEADCELGVIEKDDYLTFLREINEKARKNLINLVFSYSIFQSITKSSFETKYSHMFKYIKFERDKMIIEEKEKLTSLILVRDGEFEVTVTKNLIEINELIAKLRLNKMKIEKKGVKNIKGTFCDELKENEEYIMNKNYIRPEHCKTIFEKKQVRIAIITKRDLLGLFDMIDMDDNTSLFNVVCVSFKSEAYKMTKSALKIIAEREDRLTYEVKKFSMNKIDYFIERLNKYKTNLLSTMKKNDYLNDKFIEKNQKVKIERNRFNDKNSEFKGSSLQISTSQKKLKLPDINLYTSPNKNRIRIEKIQRLKELEESSRRKNTNRDASNTRANNSVSNTSVHSTRILDRKKYILQMSNKYTNVLSSYLHVVSAKRRNIFQNEELCKKQNEISFGNNYTIDRIPTKHCRNLSSDIPTMYHINPSSKVNYVDCLIMDKFNNLYSKGLLKDFSK